MKALDAASARSGRNLDGATAVEPSRGGSAGAHPSSEATGEPGLRHRAPATAEREIAHQNAEHRAHIEAVVETEGDRSWVVGSARPSWFQREKRVAAGISLPPGRHRSRSLHRPDQLGARRNVDGRQIGKDARGLGPSLGRMAGTRQIGTMRDCSTRVSLKRVRQAMIPFRTQRQSGPRDAAAGASRA
jgi:hypothetical protein